MWVARFKLKDDEDIYSPICEKYSVEAFATPYSAFEKNGKIHTMVGFILSGNEESIRNYLVELKKDKRTKLVDRYHNFVFVHAEYPISRELRAEIKIFYDPEYLKIKPVKVSKDGWEYWELACLDRKKLNQILEIVVKKYHGEIFSIMEEKIKNVTNLEFSPHITEKQMESLRLAYKNGYYNYPRKLTLPKLAQLTKKSYSTFQEHLSKAENKIVDFFLKYI